MATCHSLTNINGELTGDPLDLKMFLGTEWVGKSCMPYANTGHDAVRRLIHVQPLVLCVYGHIYTDQPLNLLTFSSLQVVWNSSDLETMTIAGMQL